MPRAPPFGHRFVKAVRCDYFDFLKPLPYLIIHTEAISTAIDILSAPSTIRSQPALFTYLSNVNSGQASPINVLEFLLVYFNLRYKDALPIPGNDGCFIPIKKVRRL
jgi:hypothetical protein